MTIGEIRSGIVRLEDSRRRRGLGAWLDGLERDFADRILPVDTEVARPWGEIAGEAARRGQTIGVPDGLIAATALRRRIGSPPREAGS